MCLARARAAKRRWWRGSSAALRRTLGTPLLERTFGSAGAWLSCKRMHWMTPVAFLRGTH